MSPFYCVCVTFPATVTEIPGKHHFRGKGPILVHSPTWWRTPLELEAAGHIASAIEKLREMSVHAQISSPGNPATQF